MTQAHGAPRRLGRLAALAVALAAGGCQDLSVPRGQRTIHESGFTATFPGEGRICRIPDIGRTSGLGMDLDGVKRDCGAPTEVSNPHVDIVNWHDVEDPDLQGFVRVTLRCMPEPSADLASLAFAGRDSFVCEETGEDGMPIIHVLTLTRGPEIESVGPLYSVYGAGLSTTPARRASDVRLFRALLASVVFDAGPVEATTELPPDTQAAPD